MNTATNFTALKFYIGHQITVCFKTTMTYYAAIAVHNFTKFGITCLGLIYYLFITFITTHTTNMLVEKCQVSTYAKKKTTLHQIKNWLYYYVKIVLTILGCCRKNCEKRLLASSCLSVRLSVHVEQVYSHWPDFS